MDPGLPAALDALVEPVTCGDPESPLRWTAKSLNTLAGELTAGGHPVSDDTVRRLLAEQGFSLQANAKTWRAAGTLTVTPSFTTSMSR